MTLTEKQKKEIIEERGGICEEPNCYIMVNLEVHHMKRVCKGGTDDPSNLKVVCEEHHKVFHRGEFR